MGWLCLSWKLCAVFDIDVRTFVNTCNVCIVHSFSGNPRVKLLAHDRLAQMRVHERTMEMTLLGRRSDDVTTMYVHHVCLC